MMIKKWSILFSLMHKAGIISGMDDYIFDPKGKLTAAQGVHMLVKGLDLNLDRIRFVKEPKTTDYFDHVPNDAWYSSSMIAAMHNGIPLTRDLQPQGTLTRETFAAYLFGALSKKVNYISSMMWIEIKDQDDIAKENSSAVQNLVKSNIANLDNGSFHPKTEITRSEAVDMLYNTIQLIIDNPNLGKQTESPASVKKNVYRRTFEDERPRSAEVFIANRKVCLALSALTKLNFPMW